MNKLVKTGLCANCTSFCRRTVYSEMWQKHKSTVQIFSTLPGVSIVCFEWPLDAFIGGVATIIFLPMLVEGVGDFLIDLKEKHLENTCVNKKN
jgi:hypothetical protein